MQPGQRDGAILDRIAGHFGLTSIKSHRTGRPSLLALFSDIVVIKLTVLAVTILIVAGIVTGCARCEACKNIPGWDGRYARSAPNFEGSTGLPVTPYMPR